MNGKEQEPLQSHQDSITKAMEQQLENMGLEREMREEFGLCNLQSQST